MHPTELVMLLMILVIASTRGFPLHESEMDTKSKEVGTVFIRQYARSIPLPPSITSDEIQPPPLMEQYHSPSAMSSASKTDTERHQLEEIVNSGRLTTGDEDIDTGSLVPRNRRAIRIPGLRIPFLGRGRTRVSAPRSTGARSPPASGPKAGPGSAPTKGFSPDSPGSGRAPESPSRGGSKSKFGADASPSFEDLPRRDNRDTKKPMPDLDDLVDIAGDVADFFGSSSSEDSPKPKEEKEENDRKSSPSGFSVPTTERNSPKRDGPQSHLKGPGNFPPGHHQKGPGHFHPEGPGHFHFDGPMHFPDGDWHEW